MNKSLPLIFMSACLFAVPVLGARLAVKPRPVTPQPMPVKSMPELASDVSVGVIGPRWTYGILVKNSTDHDIVVWADGGNGREKIPVGTELVIKTSSRGPKGIYWLVGGEVHESAKFVKPEFVEIQKGNTYDITAVDQAKDMGGWISGVAVTVKDLVPQTTSVEAGQ